MPWTTILLIRHATPVAPEQGAVPEADNERPLTPSGHEAASALARDLQPLPVAAVYASPYRRAIETVEPLARSRGLEVITRPDLAERWLADRVLSDDEWLTIYRRTWDDADYRPPGGESRRSTAERALGALDAVTARHPGATVAVGTHGGLIGCLLREIDDTFGFGEALQMPMPAVHVLTSDGTEWTMGSFTSGKVVLRIRDGLPDDVEAIAGVALRSRKVARRGDYADDYLDSLDLDDGRDDAARIIERPGWRTWVAEATDGVVAYATAGPWEADGTGASAELDDLYVDPDWFRCGIGAALLARVETALRATGFDEVVLWARDGDPRLEGFYSDRGYIPQERTRTLVKDRPRAFRLWTKTLEVGSAAVDEGTSDTCHVDPSMK